MTNIRLARLYIASMFLAAGLIIPANAAVPPQTEIKEVAREPACVTLKQSVVSMINGIYSDQDKTAVEVRNECASDIKIDKIMLALEGKTQSPYTHKYDAAVSHVNEYFWLKYSVTAQPCLFPMKQATALPVACSSMVIPAGGNLVLPMQYGSSFSMSGKSLNENEKFDVRVDGYALNPDRIKTPLEEMEDISKRNRKKTGVSEEPQLKKE